MHRLGCLQGVTVHGGGLWGRSQSFNPVIRWVAPENNCDYKIMIPTLRPRLNNFGLVLPRGTPREPHFGNDCPPTIQKPIWRRCHNKRGENKHSGNCQIELSMDAVLMTQRCNGHLLSHELFLWQLSHPLPGEASGVFIPHSKPRYDKSLGPALRACVMPQLLQLWDLTDGVSEKFHMSPVASLANRTRGCNTTVTRSQVNNWNCKNLT